LVRGIQGPYVHFDFVCAACENGGAAAGTEKPADVVACFAIDRHRILREHRGSVKKGPMMLAAVETVTNADPVWESRRHNSDVAAQATAGESVHAAFPPESSGRNGYNGHCPGHDTSEEAEMHTQRTRRRIAQEQRLAHYDELEHSR
jgi:hypothetical protein